jgi:tocopherol O-methyltransferase
MNEAPISPKSDRSSPLYQQIQEFYDTSSSLWEEVWGEHMHHGYYGVDGKQPKERRQAQIDLIEELLHWGGIAAAENILDVGCGIGGSSLYLAEKFHARTTGITLSPVQANRAKERAQKVKLSDRAQFEVADALNMPFADSSFDLVWSLESGEHMPDKVKFLQECQRVLKPGGTLIMATWCHRPTPPPYGHLTPDELKHLAELYRVYCLPYVLSLPEYEQIAQNLAYQNIRTADWSVAVAPFWDAVVDSAIAPSAILGLLFSGWTTIQAALSMGLMQQGFKSGLIQFGLLAGHKP